MDPVIRERLEMLAKEPGLHWNKILPVFQGKSQDEVKSDFNERRLFSESEHDRAFFAMLYKRLTSVWLADTDCRLYNLIPFLGPNYKLLALYLMKSTHEVIDFIELARENRNPRLLEPLLQEGISIDSLRELEHALVCHSKAQRSIKFGKSRRDMYNEFVLDRQRHLAEVRAELIEWKRQFDEYEARKDKRKTDIGEALAMQRTEVLAGISGNPEEPRLRDYVLSVAWKALEKNDRRMEKNRLRADQKALELKRKMDNAERKVQKEIETAATIFELDAPTSLPQLYARMYRETPMPSSEGATYLEQYQYIVA